MRSDVDVRFYKQQSPGVWARIDLPSNIVIGWQYDIIELGGFSTGRVDLQTRWELYQFDGTERCDIYVRDPSGYWSCRYRGYVRLPQNRLDVPEGKSLDLQGLVGIFNSDYTVTRKYAYATPVDISQIATDLITDELITTGRMPDIQMDMQSVSVPMQTYDPGGKSLAQCLSDLCGAGPGQCQWGGEVADVGSALLDRVYLRPRATEPKYVFRVGQDVEVMYAPADVSTIVNRVTIEGGTLQTGWTNQPNILPNGGFENPLPPGDLYENLLGDGGFETAAKESPPDSYPCADGAQFWFGGANHTVWTFYGAVGVNGDTAVAGVTGAPHSGQRSVYLEPAVTGPPAFGYGTITGQATIDPSRPFRVALWCQGVYPFIARVEALDVSMSVLEYADITGTPSVDAEAAGVDGTGWFRYFVDIDWSTTAPTAALVQVGVLLNPQTFPAELNVDDVCIYYTDSLVQEHWKSFAYQSAPAQINWAHKATALDANPPHTGDYCVKVVAPAPATGGYVEICTSDNSRVHVDANKTYGLGFRIMNPSGAADITITVGYKLYTSPTAWIPAEGLSYNIAGDGLWHPIATACYTGGSSYDAAAFVRIYSAGTLYIDSGMMVDGAALPQEWWVGPGVGGYWAGDTYEITLDTNIMAGALNADAAPSISTYGIHHKREQSDMVVDRDSAIAFARGYLNANAVPQRLGTLRAREYTGRVGLDGQYRAVGIEPSPAPQAAAALHVALSPAGAITVEASLSNEGPSMALLLIDYVKRFNAGLV